MTFVTAIVGGLVVLVADRVRWRREDRRRWVNPRRELCTSFLDAVDRWEELDHEELLDLSRVRYSSPPRSCGGASDDLVASSERFQRERSALVDVVRRELGAD